MAAIGRVDRTLKEKIEILNKIKDQLPGTSERKLAEIVGLPKSTLRRLRRQETELRDVWERHKNRGSAATASRKRQRDAKSADVDKALAEWFDAALAKGQVLTGPILLAKASEFAVKLDDTEFKASEGFLYRWKKRRSIVYKRACGEKASADVKSAEQWIETELPKLLEEYEADNVYNADETDLYYRATPDGSLCHTKDKLAGSKKAIDRVTVLCCANMSGTDNRKLLVIGKSKKPRCFKGIDIEKLPVSYCANKNAWMTGELFTQWLKEWNACLVREKRSILLLVDNCTAHPHVKLSNIKLQFLPPNTTSVIQPMDQGVIKNLKTLYRKELIFMILRYIDEDLLNPNSKATDISSKISIMDAVNLLAKSWRAVRQTTIQNCFRHAGFQAVLTEVNDDVEDGNFDASWSDISLVGGDEYNCIDDDVHCWEELRDDEDLTENIVARHRRIDEEEGNDQEDEDDEAATALQCSKNILLNKELSKISTNI